MTGRSERTDAPRHGEHGEHPHHGHGERCCGRHGEHPHGEHDKPRHGEHGEHSHHGHGERCCGRHGEHLHGEHDRHCHSEHGENCCDHHRQHSGHPGHGPSAEELQDRLETGNLSELMHMCGHVLHRRPEAGAARGQGKVLSILADEGTVSQKLLQEALHIQPGSMSEIVTKLENKGLLTRTRGQDRRGNVLSITEEGRKAAQKEDVSVEDLFGALSEDQQYQLRSLLQTLLTDWLKRFDSRFANRD